MTFNMKLMRTRQVAAIVIAFCLLLAVWIFWRGRSSSGSSQSSVPANSQGGKPAQSQAGTKSADLSPTNVYAHNLMLRKGPNFRIYVRWLRGQMARSRKNVNPSFDDPDSFSLYIKTGVIRANIGDIANYLNSGALGDAPIKNIQLSGDGDEVKMRGTVHKVIPLPVELIGTLSVIGENGIQIHVKKVNVLKIPFKGMLNVFHVTAADLFKVRNIPGLEVTDNDIRFDTHALLPPPHISGHLTRVHVVNPDLEEVYGEAQEDVERTEEWRNFLRLNGGSIDFGKLTMHNVDLIMIDISKDPWFDLDLANYQDQLVNGYTRMTPQAGLQIFMPDLRDIKNPKKSQDISIEWFKNRDLPPPPDVVKK